MSMLQIPFNKIHLTGKEISYIADAITRGKIAGDGFFTKKCHTFFEEEYGFQKALLTTSCTDALEMAALLIDIEAGDEIIAPSYTFVSTVNPFLLRGAKIRFVDSLPNHPNMDVSQIEALINEKTKAIVVVHYAGIAVDMKPLMEIADRHGLKVIEDAAQGIDSYYHDRPLGSIGHLGAFSFHETKNISSGEGGMLLINDPQYNHQAEIIREKGTNRSQFFRGEVDKYGWMAVGSSFLPSDMIAAYLLAQLEHLEDIQHKRLKIWHFYYENLQKLADAGYFTLPFIPDFATNNAHTFYIVLPSLAARSALMQFLKTKGIHTTFHYLALHNSTYFSLQHDNRLLPNSEHYTDCLLRLPLYADLNEEEQLYIIAQCYAFYENNF